jgi:hypothetical protein
MFPGGSAEAPWPAGGAPLELEYGGGGAFLAATGEGRVGVTLDGAAREPVRVEGPGLYAAVAHQRHEAHRLELDVPASVELYSVQFAPAPPA